MKTIIHDLGKSYDLIFKNKCENVISADGKYAPCQGCFGCWTKHPAQCHMKDSLQNVRRRGFFGNYAFASNRIYICKRRAAFVF